MTGLLLHFMHSSKPASSLPSASYAYRGIKQARLILHGHPSFPKVPERATVGRFHFKTIKVTTTQIEPVKLKVTP